jgi:uncharacterized RDD family membrane protein YckC
MPTPEQIDPTKVTGRRAIAAIIDGLIIAIPTFLVLTAQFRYREGVSANYCDEVFLAQGDGVCVVIGTTAYETRDLGLAPHLLGLALSLVVYVILQGLTGFTPGKLLTGIRNVREDGRAPGILKAFVRWLLWIVDGFPYFLPLVGLITALSTPGHRRVGDMAAKTFVVRRAAMGSPILVPGMTAPVVPAYAGAPGGWSAPPPPGGSWAPPPPQGPPPQGSPPQGAPPPPSDPSQAGWAAPTSGQAAPTSPAWPTGEEQAAPPPGPATADQPEDGPAAPAHAAPPEPEPELDREPTEAADTSGSAERDPADATEPAGTDPDATVTDAPAPASDATAVDQPAPASGASAAGGDATAVAPAAPEPQWDAARGTYIQWDPAQQRWLQWDEAASSWVVIPGQ